MIVDSVVSKALTGLPSSHVLPTMQLRSLERQKAMLSAGLKLTEQADWEKVSVAEIAAVNGFSVGSFYTRFQNKQAYLDVLISIVALQIRKKMDIFIAEQCAQNEPAVQKLDNFIAQTIHTFLSLKGIIRMSVVNRRKDTNGEVVTYPFTEARAYSCEQFVQLMMPYLNVQESAQGEQYHVRLSFAHQMINSTLMNAILTDPGPVHLNDEVFKQEMVAAISAYIGLKQVTEKESTNEKRTN